LSAALDIYLFFGGLVCIVLELKEKVFTQKYMDVLKREALFLTRPYGRAAFYFFVGILMSCQGGILSIVGGVGKEYLLLCNIYRTSYIYFYIIIMHTLSTYSCIL
jgi:hypothetical protein